MRLEFNATGSSKKGKKQVDALIESFNVLASSHKKVVNSFVFAKSDLAEINEDPESSEQIQEALECVDHRIQSTENPVNERVEDVGRRFANFVINAVVTDKNVYCALKIQQAEFYKKCPWAEYHPPKKKKWYKKAIDAICGFFVDLGKAIADAFKAVWNGIKKAWNATVDFIKKHYKTILKVIAGVVLIAGLFVLSVVTGGAAAPIFAAAAQAALTAALTSTAAAVVTGIAQGKSFGEIFDSAGNAFFIGAVTGAITGAAGTVGGIVTGATGSAILGKAAEILAQGAAKFLGEMLIQGAEYLAEHGTLSGFFSNFAENTGMEILGSLAGSVLDFAGDILMDQLGELYSAAVDYLCDTSFGQAAMELFDNIKESTSWLFGEDGILGTLGLDSLSAIGIDDISDVIEIIKDPSKFAENLGETVLGNLLGSDNIKEILGNGLSTLADAMGLSEIFDNLSLETISDALGLDYEELKNLGSALGLDSVDLEKLGEAIGIGNADLEKLGEAIIAGDIGKIADALGIGTPDL